MLQHYKKFEKSTSAYACSFFFLKSIFYLSSSTFYLFTLFIWNFEFVCRCAWGCLGMCGCVQVCEYAWVCTGIRRCVWDEFSEYLLETRVLTSADFNTYSIRIFMISCYIWYYNNLNLKFEISVPRILQRCSLQDLYLYWVSYFNLSNLHAIL